MKNQLWLLLFSTTSLIFFIINFNTCILLMVAEKLSENNYISLGVVKEFTDIRYGFNWLR